MKSIYFFLFFLLFNLPDGAKVDAQNNSSVQPFRIQYDKFQFKQYNTKKYAIFYQQESDSLAKYVVENTRSIIMQELEDSLMVGFNQKVNIIVYNSIIKASQTNIGQLFEQHYAGLNFPFNSNRIILYYEGDRRQFIKDLKKQLAELILNQHFYGSKIDEVIRNLYKEPLETWFVKGATRYITERWTTENDNEWKQLILIPKEKTFEELANKNADLSGNALLFYIERTYGSPFVYRFIDQTRQKKNIAKACQLVFKIPLWKLQENCLIEDVNRYLIDNKNQQNLDTVVLKNRINTKKEMIQKSNVVLHPNKQYFAYTRLRKNKQELVVESIDNKIIVLQKNNRAFSNSLFKNLLCWDNFKQNRLAFIY